VLEFQTGIIEELKDKHVFLTDYLKQLNSKYKEESLPKIIEEMEEDQRALTEERSEQIEVSELKEKEDKEETKDIKEKDYKAMEQFQNVEHSFEHSKVRIH
jgi:hypothetical protein